MCTELEQDKLVTQEVDVCSAYFLCGGSQQAVRMQIFREAAATQFEVGMSQDSVGGWKRMKE